MSTRLLVHGAWGGAWEFQETIKSLNQQGHVATAIDLPGHGQSPTPISEVTMETYIQRVIEATQNIEGKIILVGHSLGGAVISQVAEQIPDKIERLVYVAAILPAHDQTPIGLLESDRAGQLLSKLKFSDDQSYVTVEAEDVKDIFLHDVKEADRVESLVPHFAVQQATQPFMASANLTQDAFGSVSKTYIRATHDKIIPLSLQNKMLASWEVDQVLTLESGHFPLMSMPERLAQAISEATAVTI